jgi:hypothetical protein
VLAPLAFRRNGRSRIWLADHGFWLGVVEFQPSSWSKGSYCNVGVHWPWSLTPTLSFDHGFARVGSFAAFEDAVRFADNIGNLASAAARASERFAVLFTSLRETATVLERDEAHATRPNGWSAFHAGVASGLIGETEAARRMFDRVAVSDARDIDWVRARLSRAKELSAALSEPARFRKEVQELVDAQRRYFKLAPYLLPS